MRRKIIGKKLYVNLLVSFFAIILVSIILTVVGVITIRNIKNNYSYVISMSERKIRTLKDTKIEYTIMRYKVLNIIINSGNEEYIYQVANQQIKDAMTALLEHLEYYIQLNSLDTRQDEETSAKNIENAEEFKDRLALYRVYSEWVMKKSAEGDAQAADDLLKQVVPLAQSSIDLLDKMIASADETINAVTRSINDSASTSVVFLVLLAAVLVMLAVIISSFLFKYIAEYIENLRKAELAAEEATRMKSVFLANMSHEIRTPMNGIIGFAELALDDNISQQTKEYLENIKYSAEGLLSIINDILDSSKIEAGKMVLENIPFNLEEVFEICQAIIKPNVLEKGISLFCYAEPALGRKIMGDPTKIRQVLLNLLSNSVKFTNVGIIKLSAVVIEETENTATMHFEVKDSGIGMSQEQIGRIFEPFTQADDGTTRKYGGTGLGLSITKSIIEMMGGQLSVESTLGVGSKFSFNLTFETVKESLQKPEVVSNPDKYVKPIFRGEVLVCEDNRMNQQVINGHLAKVGLRTTIANNGKEGVDYVLERIKNDEPPFDIIFMDIHMPVMDGFETANVLNGIGCKTPIIALTANVMPTDRKTYQEAGIPDCLAKPFTARELWNCLLKYLFPVSADETDAESQSEADRKLEEQLLRNFYTDNQHTYQEICDSVLSGDLKHAHRLAHTLKGIAGLIKNTKLRESASVLEAALSEGLDVTEDMLTELNTDINSVFDLVEPESAEEQPRTVKTVDKEDVLAIMDKLEPLLSIGDTDCLEFIEDLREIPDFDELVERIEHFDFQTANRLLNELTKKIGS